MTEAEKRLRLQNSVIQAAKKFVEAHEAHMDTLPHKRRKCLVLRKDPQEGPQSCYQEAMYELKFIDRDIEIDPYEDGFCEACEHNWEMVQIRATRARAANGALRSLVAAVDHLDSWEGKRRSVTP
jgi:hypothetical protein